MFIRIQNRGLKSALVCLGLAAAAQSAWGATSQITVSSYTSFSINSAVYDTGSGVPNASSGWAGKWISKISGGSVPAGYTLNQDWNGFCTDIGNTMGTGTYTYQASPFSAATDTDDNNGIPPDPKWSTVLSGNKAAWVYNQHQANTSASLIHNFGSGNVTHNFAANELAAAMCLAVWELLYEGSGTYDVRASVNTGRSFRTEAITTSDNAKYWVTELANTWLTEFANIGNTGITYTWWAELQTPDVQSLLGPPIMVPEPGTYIAGFLLGLPILINGIRFWRKRRVS